ncbi:ATP-binding protein [Neptuniibacter sp.]|uniref:ATP-binding protein n=1 Tax=Neptuniibacter sp. TaxID=1962643 RepID=UPI002636ECFD|nr:ATP-binding protein [Neptuniibacter sp.]
MPYSGSSQWRRYRLLFFIVLAFAFLLVVGQTMLVSRSQGQTELQQRSGADLNRYLLSLQQKLDRYKDLPGLLASHSILINALHSPQDDLLKGEASLYLQQVNDSIGAADVYLMDTVGTAISASNWKEERSFVGKNYSFRPYFKDAMEGKEGRYFALGTVSKKRGYYFSYPVQDVQENIIGVVVVKIDLNEIESDWNDPDLDILVTDEDGVIFISTREDWKFRTLRPLSQVDIKRIAESLRYGDHRLTALDIIKRDQRDEGGQLITLVDGQRINNPAFDGVSTREFLLLSRSLEGSGLNVVVLASTKPVHERMFYSAITSGFIFVAMVLLVLFLSTRQRITRERARFKRLETQALEANEERVREIIDNTQAGLITLDAQGRIESMNTMAEKLFGYAEETIKDQYFSKFLAQADRAICWRHITAQDHERLEELFIEANGLRQDGSTFPIELIIGYMDYGSEKRFIVTIHDITQRKQYEEELQHARDLLEHRVEERTADLTDANQKLVDEVEKHKNTQNELIQTAKLAVLGQMSAGINHELNQPLTAIRTYADNARAFMDMGKMETVETNLQQISGLTERMAKIIHPLKEFSRKTSGQPESVCLQNVHDGAMSIMYGRLHKADATVNWPDGLSKLYVMGDTVRLEQVLVNLISNALQAMEEQDSQQIDISTKRDNGQVTLQVRDYGPGIPVDEVDRVFEPFYTTKKAGQGLGLGLSISHRIIESMGGELSVANHIDGGAVFTLCLPAAPAPDNVVG